MHEWKVLVTGGSGFIGTNLTESMVNAGVVLLNLDITPPLNTRHNQYWRKVDILEPDSLGQAIKAFQPTHIVHLAARTDINEKQSLDGYKTNIQGTENVLKAIAATPSVKRVIIASSMLVCRLGYVPCSDQDYAPPNLYGESKVLTEKITRNFGLGCTWTIIRPTTIWGPWSIRYRDEFFRVLRRGHYFHPGNQRIMKCYGFVGNSVFQIQQLLKAPESLVCGKMFYVGDPPVDLREWVGEFSKKLCGKDVHVIPLKLMRLFALVGDFAASLGIKSPLTSFRLNNMTINNLVDLSPTMDVCGPVPFSLHDGVALTVDWLRENEGGSV